MHSSNAAKLVNRACQLVPEGSCQPGSRETKWPAIHRFDASLHFTQPMMRSQSLPYSVCLWKSLMGAMTQLQIIWSETTNVMSRSTRAAATGLTLSVSGSGGLSVPSAHSDLSQQAIWPVTACVP